MSGRVCLLDAKLDLELLYSADQLPHQRQRYARLLQKFAELYGEQVSKNNVLCAFAVFDTMRPSHAGRVRRSCASECSKTTNLKIAQIYVKI
jgi:hypothetical protein